MSDDPGFTLPQQPQRQDSLADQLRTVHVLAARAGCYDAADWLWKRIDHSPDDAADRIEALEAALRPFAPAYVMHRPDDDVVRPLIRNGDLRRAREALDA